jgi:DNA-binding GntR family transcriptional regulator
MPTDQIERIDLKPNILAEQVSRILSDAILEGVLKGGDKLIEAELQKKFGISRSPLREAFRDLEKKGLVVIIPRKGTLVKRITRKDIEDNFPVRSVLEGLAAKEAFQKMTDQDQRDLVHSLQKMEAAVKTNNTKNYWKYHLKFHETFIDASYNAVLVDILRTLRMHSMWYRFSYQYYQEDLQKSLAVHQKIYALFRNPASDPEILGELVQLHIEEAYWRFLAYLKSQGNASY